MSEKLIKLHNTMGLIETKGESTKIMAECMKYLEQLIAEEKENENKANEPTEV